MRPLPRGLWLPAAALGLVAGEVAGYGGDGLAPRLVAAAVLASPVLARRHRAGGVALGIAALAAAFGLLLAAADHSRRAAAAGAPEVVARVDAVIERVRARAGFGGRQGAALDVRVVAASAEHATLVGDRARVSVWEVRSAWAAGERVRMSLGLRPPRGVCNGGEDAYASRLWRLGIRRVASLRDDAAIVRLGGVDPGIRSALARARQRTARSIDAALAPGEAAVLRALVVGDPAGLPDDLRDAFARTGTTHVLSVSGLHVAIVAGSAFQAVRAASVRLPWLAARLLPARLAAIGALGPACAYAFFAGAAVATVRSLLMAAIFLCGVALVRAPDLLVAVAAAAIAICAADPTAPFDVSFQLSFAAVLAIVVGMRAAEESPLGPMLRPARDAGRLARARAVAVSAVAVSVAAALGTAPLTAAHFGVVPVAGVLGNLVVVPLVGWVALLAGLSGALLLALADGAAAACFSVAGLAIRAASSIVLRLASVPGAAVGVAAPSAAEAACCMGALFAVPLARRGRRLAAAAVGLAAVVAVSGLAAAQRSRTALRVSFLDVGQGDAALVELPGRRALVVDAGGLPGGFDPGAWVVVPALRARGLGAVDALVLSHPQLDHYGGMAAVVAALPVARFVSSGAGATSRSFSALREALAAAGVRERTVLAGHELEGFPGARAEVLHPDRLAIDASANDASLVLAVRHGAMRVLLPGDLEARGERRLIQAADDLTAVVVKAPHHGSRSSSTSALVRASRPGLVVAGVAARNRFGLPADEVRERWRRHGAVWRDTGRHGEVVVESDGQIATVATCHDAAAALAAPARPPSHGEGRVASRPPGRRPRSYSAAAARPRLRRDLSMSAKRKRTS